MKVKRFRYWLSAVAVIGVIGGSIAVAHAATSAAPFAQLDGQLMVAHGDTFGSGPMVMQTALRTANGIVPITLPAARHEQALALAGKHVRVRGVRDASAFDAASITPAASNPPAASPRKYRIATVIFENVNAKVQPFSMDTVRDTMYGPEPYSVSSYLDTSSGGQLDVSGTAYGPYPMPKKISGGSCDLSGWDDAGAAAAAADGYDAANFDSLVVYAPKSCNFSGIAWVGAGGVFIANAFGQGVIEHELGHNLGLWHAGACAGAFSPGCSVDTYGDPTDVMGSGWGDYEGYHKLKLGWIPQSELATQTSGTHVYTLTPSETPVVAGATEIVEVPRGDGTTLEVERRDRLGNDTGGGGGSGLDLKLITMTGTDDSLYVASLTPGTSWVDPTQNLTFTGLSDSQVKVCVGPCTNGGGTTTTATSTTSTSSTSSTSSTTTTTIKPSGSAVAVSVVKGRIEVIGTPGADTVHLTKVHDNLKTVDANGAALSVGAGCGLDPSAVIPTADCRGGGFDAHMGNGDDTVVVSGARIGVRNVLDGGAGNDLFVGGLGADTFIGGAGDDTVSYEGRPVGSVTALIGGGPHSGARGERDDISSDIEHVLMP
jgi:hypothetical protein